jgi:Cation efflux family
VIGFLGNELVALLRIRVGRQIGSAALVADGLHARTDGITSLAVLAGAIGAALGFPLLDPLIGMGVGVAILVIVWGAAREMWFHILDMRSIVGLGKGQQHPGKPCEANIDERQADGQQEYADTQQRTDCLAAALVLIQIGIDKPVLMGGIPPQRGGQHTG